MRKVLTSRVAASVLHAPIQKSEELASTYVDWGARLPSAGSSVTDVQANIDYTARELKQWRATMQVTYAEGMNKYADDVTERSLGRALQFLSKSLNEENKVAINATLQGILGPLRPWVGAIISDDLESCDRQVAHRISHVVAWKAILDLYPYAGRSNWDLELTPFGGLSSWELRRTAEKEIQYSVDIFILHCKRARIDRLVYIVEHPFHWLYHKATDTPKRLVQAATRFVGVARPREPEALPQVKIA